jgi:hypothetical protein
MPLLKASRRSNTLILMACSSILVFLVNIPAQKEILGILPSCNSTLSEKDTLKNTVTQWHRDESQLVVRVSPRTKELIAFKLSASSRLKASLMYQLTCIKSWLEQLKLCTSQFFTFYLERLVLHWIYFGCDFNNNKK